MVLSLNHNFATNQSHADFFIFLYSAINFHFRNFESPLGQKLELEMQIEKDLNYINTRIKLQSFRALKRYLNDENMAHDRKTETIKKFTEQHL